MHAVAIEFSSNRVVGRSCRRQPAFARLQQPFVGNPPKLTQHRSRRKVLAGAQSFQSLSSSVVSELNTILSAVDSQQLNDVLSTIERAARGNQRICCYGVGREGLCMKGLAMRLFHAGIQGGVVGEMTCPPVCAGDLLLLSAGPGYFSTVAALAVEAHRAGAQVVVFTAQDTATLSFGDMALRVPSATLPVHGSSGGSSGARPSSVLQMGSSYEAGLWLVFDILSIMLQERLQLGDADMKGRHTNLE